MSQTLSSTTAATASSTAARVLRTRSVKGLVLGVVLGVAAAVSVPVMAGGYGHGGYDGHHGMMMGGKGGFMGSPQHVERMVDRLLRDVDATEQQRSQVRQIALAAATDLQGQREAGRQLRQQMQSLFTQPEVDAAAVEQLRQQSMAQADARSRRMSQAMVDIARVLTPEQRARIGERMAERQRRFEQRMQQREPGRPDAPRQ